MNVLQALRKTFSSKAISIMLVVVMLFGAVPASPALVANAAGEQLNVRLHVQLSGWTEPALQVWGGDEPVVSGNGIAKHIEQWGENDYATPLIPEEDNWYSVTVKGDIGGGQFLDLNDPSGNLIGSIHQIVVEGSENLTILNYKGSETTDLYFVGGNWYLSLEAAAQGPSFQRATVNEDGSVTFALKAPDATTVQLAGDMTDWGSGALSMTKNGETGVFSITLENLSEGLHEYKFIIDETWKVDPIRPL